MSLVDSYRGKRILLTGDTGFKGSWLATWLLHYGAEVVGFALPATASTDNYVVSGLASRYEHIDGDVRDHARLAALIAERRPEIVFHLAAQSLVLEGYAAPRETFDTNIMGTINVLDAVRSSSSVRAVVVVSSDKCYAGHLEVAAYRETDPMGGLDPYSASKGAAELAVAAMRYSYFRGESTAAVATARAGNVIGGGDWAKHRIVPDSIRALRDGVPITVRNPLAVRPWQHVLDALHGYLVLGARLLTDRDRFASGWNFGPTETAHISVLQLVEALIAAWGKGSHNAKVDPGARAEAVVLALDSLKSRELLGWKPVAALQRAVEWTVAGYRAEIEAPASVFQNRTHQIVEFESLANA